MRGDQDPIHPPDDPTASLGPAPTPAGAPDRIGPGSLVAGRYRVGRRIGVGGMGEVFQATDEQLHRSVALKVIGPLGADAESALSEARKAARLRHPGIAAVYDAGILTMGAGSMAFIAMELVAGGERIDAWAKRTGADLARVARVLADVCDAVSHAHARGVIHGDLKPSNTLVDADGAPRVIDFGVSRALGVDEPLQDSRGGTPGYAPPEQEHPTAPALDGRADVYALGVMARAMVHGMPASDAQSRDLAAILAAATHENRIERMESPAALGANLRALADGRPVPVIREAGLAPVRRAWRRSAARAPWVWATAAALLGFVVTIGIGIPVVHAWTPIARWVMAGVGLVPRATGTAPLLEDVRVILLRDGDDMEALGAREGLPDVRADNLQSWRRVHGRLMERLSAAGPRAVVWDIVFRGPADSDPDLVRGMRALQARGAGVVVAARDWVLDADGLPMVSRAVLEAAGWGVATGVHTDKEPWRVDLLVDRGDGSGVTPSLALRTIGAMQSPDAELDVALDRSTGIATVRVWRPVPGVPSARGHAGPARTITVSAIETPSPQNASLGIRADDRIGVLVVEVPSDAMLAERTVGYTEVFDRTAQELRDFFAGRVVVIGSVRNGADLWPHPDGRTIPGPWSHACAIGTLMRGGVVRVPTPVWDAIGVAVFSVAGAAAGIVSGRGVARAVFLACLTAVGAAVTIGFYAFADLLMITPVQMVGAIVAWEIAGAAARARH